MSMHTQMLSVGKRYKQANTTQHYSRHDATHLMTF